MKDTITREKTNYCVICGNEIPEGVQVCPDCARSIYYKETWERKNPKKKKKRVERAESRKWI